MRWLLITNNANPGDIWVRLGVQKIIQYLDQQPVFILRDRDERLGGRIPGLSTPEKHFDYSVVCGMPLLWSHQHPNGTVAHTLAHPSWKPLKTWCSDDRRMIIAGFGVFLLCPEGLEKFKIHEPDAVIKGLHSLFQRCLGYYSRSPLAERFFPGIDRLDCPSVLALPQSNGPKIKLCNFMPGGSHYPDLEPEAAGVAELKMPDLCKKLIAAHFQFIAHTPRERDFAVHLGWPKERILWWMPEGGGPWLIDTYARCSKYLGNRIHGGIMARAAGADVVVIGYDTRLADVQVMGGKVHTPFELPDLSSWIEAEPQPVPYDRQEILKKHLSWWSSRVNTAIKI